MLKVSITKSIGNFKLSSSFTCGRETLAILGPSGCGKSITLKCISGLLKPDKGIIELDGIEFFNSDKKINISPQKRNIGYVFQNYALFPHLTVYENIAYGINNLDKRIRHEKVINMIEKMELKGLEKRFPSQLSGGQQQRVAIARSIIKEPRLLLLDEPFSALDTNVKSTLRKELIKLVKEKFDGTVILVTHDIEEAYIMSDKILIMNHGQAIQTGGKEEVILNPVSLEAARITGCKNFFDAKFQKREGQYIIIKIQNINLYVDNKFSLKDFDLVAGIRAEDIKILDKKGDKLNTFDCKIIDKIEGISYVTIIADIMGTIVEVEVSKYDYSFFKDKDSIILHIPSDKILLFNR